MMQMQSEFCPFCSKNGTKVRVMAYQLNMQEAVFMCSTPECTWPAGYHELLLMDRPLGKYTNEEWPIMADEFLANFLKKQRDSISELSAYTPPQTPGNSKDTIHDTSTAGPSSLTTTTIDLTLDQQPSCSKSKELDLPVVDLTVDSTVVPSFEIIIDDLERMVDTSMTDMSIVNLEPFIVPKPEITIFNVEPVVVPKSEIIISNEEPVVAPKSEKVSVNIRSNITNTSSLTTHTILAKPLPKPSVSSLNKSVISSVKKPNLSVPEVKVASKSVPSKKFKFLGRKKSEPFTYKKEFDIFDKIKQSKSTNEQSHSKNTVVHKIGLVEMKPKETKKVFIVSKAKTSDQVEVIKKIEPNVNVNVKTETQEQPTSEKEIVSDPTHYDLDAIIKNATDLESNNTWLDKDQNFDNLLDMLQGNEPLETLENEKVEPIKVDIDSIVEDDTLLCNIEDTEDDAFLSSLFSPPMNH